MLWVYIYYHDNSRQQGECKFVREPREDKPIKKRAESEERDEENIQTNHQI